MNAYSGRGSPGHRLTSVLLHKNAAEVIFIPVCLMQWVVSELQLSDFRLKIPLLQPGLQDVVEIIRMFHHGGVPAFRDPEQI